MPTSFNPRVTHLGYVGLGVSDLTRSREHYGAVLGLVETGKDKTAIYLSVGPEHHNIVLRQADQKSFLHLGYQLNPNTELKEFAKAAKAFGAAVEIKTDSQPGIPELVEVTVPGGNIFQFFSGSAASGPGFGRAGVRPIRLGHVAVISPEATKLRAFYEDFLGFHYTDDIGGVATFMTCNRDHHVVNLVNMPESRLHHVAFELADNADHVKAADMLASAGSSTLWGPARHYAGHNLAAYHYDPDRVMIELYTQMDVYLPAVGAFEPRPWHEQNPLRPQSWGIDKMTNWETGYVFNLVMA